MKRKEQLQQLRALSETGLAEKAQELKSNILKMRVKKGVGQLTQVNQIPDAKKELARVNTMLSALAKNKTSVKVSGE